MFAKRMGATIREVNASHVPYMSKPTVVAKMIEDAAQAPPKETATLQK